MHQKKKNLPKTMTVHLISISDLISRYFGLFFEQSNQQSKCSHGSKDVQSYETQTYFRENFYENFIPIDHFVKFSIQF